MSNAITVNATTTVVPETDREVHDVAERKAIVRESYASHYSDMRLESQLRKVGKRLARRKALHELFADGSLDDLLVK